MLKLLMQLLSLLRDLNLTVYQFSFSELDEIGLNPTFNVCKFISYIIRMNFSARTQIQ